MYLKKLAREFYNLSIATVPAVSGWEASFDGGATWKPGEVVGGKVRWLVAGADADPGTATVLTTSVKPLLRVTDNPEIIVRDAPTIYIQG